MSAYEDLVERCAMKSKAIPSYSGRHARVRCVIAEVLRTLETVTPEMLAADWPVDETADAVAYEESGGNERVAIWLAMLRASPLMPSVQP